MCSMCKENMLLPFFIDADIRAIKFKMSLGKKHWWNKREHKEYISR